MKKVIIVFLLVMSSGINAGNRSFEFCDGLANIGGTTVKARAAGHSLSAVLGVAEDALSDSPDKLNYATAVVTAIYGDRSITSYDQGYNTVFQTCME